jgi:nucleotide-binding universal stress UspA family protein
LRTLDDRLAVRAEKPEDLVKTFVAMGLSTITELPMVRPGWTGLLKAAETQEADLIVVATRSKAPLKRMFVGSTVEELIKHAERPVLTVGPNVAAPSGDLEFNWVVYATDFSPEADKAARAALLFAEHSGRSIHVCHVVDCPVNSEEGRTETDRWRKVQRLLAASALGENDCELEISFGESAESILALAKKVDADLIVMGPRKHSFWLTHVQRGVTLKVLARARCPVLTVH